MVIVVYGHTLLISGRRVTYYKIFDLEGHLLVCHCGVAKPQSLYHII